MANVEIKINTIVDKAIADLKKTAGAVGEVDNSVKKSGGGIGDFSGAMTGLNQALEVANKVMQAAKMIHDETVGVFISYAAQVRDMARATGESAEQSSRLIQVADDVGISYDALKTSLQIAARHGIDVSTESLKAMSDEYLTLAPGTERMQFLLERFGRSGATMGRLMEMGAEGIEKLNDGIESGLILSAAVLKQAKVHDVLVDVYNDLIEAKKIAIGTNLSEVESWIMMQGAITAQLQIMAQEQQALEGVTWARQDLQYWMSENRGEAEKSVQAMLDGRHAAEENAVAIAGLASAEQDLATATDGVTAAQKRLEDAQKSWLDKTAGEVAAALEKLGARDVEALAAIDDVLGTTLVKDQKHIDNINQIAKDYAESKDVSALKDALQSLKDTELPEATKELTLFYDEAIKIEDTMRRIRDDAAKPIIYKIEYETVGSMTAPPGNP